MDESVNCIVDIIHWLVSDLHDNANFFEHLYPWMRALTVLLTLFTGLYSMNSLYNGKLQCIPIHKCTI